MVLFLQLYFFFIDFMFFVSKHCILSDIVFLVLTSDVVRITHQKGHWTPGPPRTEERSKDITLTW
jgi:hypothetical protein